MARKHSSDPAALPSVDTAIATVTERRARDGVDREAARQEAARLYCQILTRADAPASDDARNLTDMLEDGFVTVDQLKRDREAVSEVRRQLALIAEKDAATAACRAAIETRDKLDKDFQRDFRLADIAVNTAQAHVSACAASPREIAVVLGQHPLLKEGGLQKLLEASPA